jgi:hypothetical protein
MWLITDYRPASLFSLKIGVATSTGAKTLFLPTPFVIRTALLDASIRTRGKDTAEHAFETLKLLKIAAFPPAHVTVTNLFVKVQKPTRPKDGNKKSKENEPGDDEEQAKPMTPTIAFREYAHLDGTLALAFEGEIEALKMVEELAPQINYFGKRGSFFQWMNHHRHEPTLHSGFMQLDMGTAFENGKVTSEMPTAFPLGVIQLMDDWGEALTFEKVNVYSDARIEIPEDRVRHSVVFPYRLARSSRGFSYYEWQSI